MATLYLKQGAATLLLSTVGGGGGPAAPAAPSLLVATALGAGSIGLTWSDNSDDETGFTLERSLNGSTWGTAALPAADATSYTDAGLDPETLYYYRIKARNDAGSSAYSNTDTATTDAVDPGGELVTLTLTNTSSSATPATTFMPFGHPFAQGDVPTGYRLAATWNGSAVPVQVIGRNSWPDGSLRFGRLVVKLPSVAGSGSGTLALAAESGSPSTTIPGGKTASQVAADLTTNSPYTVTVANLKKGYTPVADGSGAWTWAAADQLALLGTVDSRGRVRSEVLGAGPLCTVLHAWGPVRSAGADHKHLVVRGFYCCYHDAITGAIDRVETMHNVEQGWIEDLSGGTTNADLQVGDFAVKLGGATVTGRSWTGMRVPHFTIHHLTRVGTTGTPANAETGGSDWTSGSPTLRATFDTAYWNSTGVMPPYDLTLSVAADSSPKSYSPGAADGFGSYAYAINDTGDRQAIGLLAGWSVRAYLTQEAGWLRTDLANALIHGRMPCWVRNPSTGRIPVTMPTSALAATSNALMGGSRHEAQFLGAENTFGNFKVATVSYGSGAGDTSNSHGGWSGPFYASHWPHPVHHQLLRTGAPWLLELAKLSAHQTVLCNSDAALGTVEYGGNNYRGLVRPDASTGWGTFIWVREERHEGWSWPSWVSLLATLPDDAVERPYALAVYASNVESAKQIISGSSTAFRTLGCWTPKADNSVTPANDIYFGSGYMVQFCIISRAWEYLALGRPADTLTWLNHVRKMVRGFSGGDPLQTCPWGSVTYRQTYGYGADYYDDWGKMPQYHHEYAGLSFAAATGWVTGLSKSTINLGNQAFSVGDMLFFTSLDYAGATPSPAPPASGTSNGVTVTINPRRPYYVAQVDAANNRVKLSPNANGTNPFTAFSSSPSGIGCAVRLAACPTPSATNGTVFQDEPGGAISYPAHMGASIRLLKHCGVIGDADAAWADAYEARLEACRALRNWAGNGVDWNHEPRLRFAEAT